MMKAKLRVADVKPCNGYEELVFNAVVKSEAYPDDGSDENNTFAMYTLTAELRMTITNPASIGKFTIGQEFYADFTEVGQ